MNRKQEALCKRTMRSIKDNHIDYTTNLVNLTSISEETAQILCLYKFRNGESVIPERVFEIAGELFPEDR